MHLHNNAHLYTNEVLSLTENVKIRKYWLTIEMLRNRTTVIAGSMIMHMTTTNINHPGPDAYKSASLSLAMS